MKRGFKVFALSLFLFFQAVIPLGCEEAEPQNYRTLVVTVLEGNSTISIFGVQILIVAANHYSYTAFTHTSGMEVVENIPVTTTLQDWEPISVTASKTGYTPYHVSVHVGNNKIIYLTIRLT